MNSELLNVMKDQIQEIRDRIASDEKELAGFNAINEQYLNEEAKKRKADLENSIELDNQKMQEIFDKCAMLDELYQEHKNNPTDETKKNLADFTETLKEEYEEYFEEENTEEENTEEESTEETEEENTEEQSTEKENTQKKETKSKEKKEFVQKIVSLVAIACSIVALAIGIKSITNKKGDTASAKEQTSIEQPLREEKNTEEETQKVVYETEKIAGTEGPTSEEAIVGKFTDVTNDEQVSEQADVILDKLKPMLEDMDDSARKFASKENIENIIRISNGENAKDENGESYYSPTVVDQYVQARTDVFGNYPSSPQHKNRTIYAVDYADLTVCGTELHEFVAKYDSIYNAIAEARNNNDWESFEKHTKSLGETLYNDFVMNGAYGGPDPYNFKPGQRQFALGSAVERYASYVLENEDGHNSVVCVEVCNGYNTGKKKAMPVDYIFEAITTGAKNDATLSYFGSEKFSGNNLISQSFSDDLNKELEYKNSLVLERK